jgi:hypothetical protein
MSALTACSRELPIPNVSSASSASPGASDDASSGA